MREDRITELLREDKFTELPHFERMGLTRRLPSCTQRVMGASMARMIHESVISPSPGTLWVPSPIEGEGQGEGGIPKCEVDSRILRVNVSR